MKERIYTLFTKTAVAISLLSLLAMSGCQSLPSYQSGYKKIENAKQAQVWAGEIIPMLNEVNIACVGTYHCEITQIDNISIISSDTHKPVNPALLVSMASTNGKPYAKLSKAEQAQVQAKVSPLTDNKSIKIIPLTASAMPNLTNYYASVKPIKREVHINFYPENNVGYVERFALIDEFKEQGTYVLQAYRQKLAENNDSLLDSASPTPLCIDLLKDKVLKRRFCKQPDVESEGEFVELALANEANKNNKRD